jgi:transcriptional regulator with XRE-family HTH domain
VALDDLAAFGAGVRALRLRRGLTQEKLAELSELDQTYVSGIERGRRNLGVRNLFRIARALDVAGSALLAEGEGLTTASVRRLRRRRKATRTSR